MNGGGVLDPTARAGVAAVRTLMLPRSVAIIGVSSKPGTAGHSVRNNLLMNDFAGPIHLVGRGGGTVDGTPVLTSADDLPDNIDLAVFTLPAAGVKDALQACVRHKVKSAVIFSAGFAEIGERSAQDELSRIAGEGGLAILGPNCLGYTNFVDGMAIGFTRPGRVKVVAGSSDPAIAIVSHSGGLAGHIRWALETRDLPVSYNISTGNEAGLGLAEFIDYFVQDQTTRAIVVYVEEFRHTGKFLAAAARARDAGKPIVLLSPGRGARAKAAVSSHTGALAGDYVVMQTIATHAGIVVTNTLDELLDVTELLARFPKPPVKGPGILTFSGAFCALAHDFCEELGVEIPPMSPETVAHLTPLVSSYIPPKNPLDLGTQPMWQPDLMEIGSKALLDDPAIGSFLISVPIGPGPDPAMKYLKHVLIGVQGSDKPFIFAPLGDTFPLPPEFVATLREKRIILSRSSDRSLRAIVAATRYGRARERAISVVTPQPLQGLPTLGHGTQPEWLGKQLLAQAGIHVPDGALARTLDDAVAVAKRVGYPVAMKAQAAALAHKTEAGGVLLGIADEAALLRSWQTLFDNVRKHQPGIVLDGILVEAMADKGLELVIGAKRDPLWGPVLLVGLGGIWVEALGDIRLLPPDLSEAAVVEELRQLRTAKLLTGFRGAPAVDVEAVAKAVVAVGRVMMTVPEIIEIDINPVFAHGTGLGITAADALIVTQ